MSIRKWVSLFFSTLAIGGIAGIVIGLFTETKMVFQHGVVGFFVALIQLFGIGLMYSAWSQMFFYAYLTAHRFGLGMFNSVSLWNKVQVVLIAFVFFDLVYFPYTSYGHGQNFWYFFILPCFLLIMAYPVAFFKRKETNPTAFIPTIFFMFVVSALELIPAIEANKISLLVTMAIPLLICNAYQVLRLHRIVKTPRPS